MGVLDIPAPLLSAADSLIAFLPPLPRLLLWAALTGVVSMLCYWLCSAQGKVAAAKVAAAKARRELTAYEGHEFSELWPLLGASLRCSLRHTAVVLGPALLSSLPALCIIVWTSHQFGYSLPEAGAPLELSPRPASELVVLDESDLPTDTWPVAGKTLFVTTPAGDPVSTLPPAAAVPVIHQRRWWNSLIGNPAGYLDDSSPVDVLHIRLEQQTFARIGPEWLRTWEAPYFAVLLITSLLVKYAFRID